MANKQKNEISIKTRLRKMTLVAVLVFICIFIGLYFAAARVLISVDQIVEDSLKRVVENSQNSRDFGLLSSRLRVLEGDFYLDIAKYDEESKALSKDIDSLMVTVSDPELKVFLGQMKDQLSVYLERRQWINYLLFWRSGEDEDIGELFSLLQEIVAEKMVNVTLDGGDTGYFNQLVALISGYRESLFEIAKLNAEENPALLLSASMDAPVPLAFELNDLVLRLRTLVASEPPIDRLGRHLIDHFLYYRYQMQQYRNEMVRLGEINQNLDQLTLQILSLMEKQDRQTAEAASHTRQQIRKSIMAITALILALLLVLALLSWASLRSLFNKHIQTPITLISERLDLFQQGDHSSPMQLARQDEWGTIEVGFNRMLSVIQQNVAALEQSEKHYRDIYNNITEGIFRTTLAGKIVDLNPSAVAILGFESLSDGLNAYTDIGREVFVDPMARQQMIDLLHEKKKLMNYEVKMYRYGGEIFWASLNNYFIYDEHENIIGIEGVIEDITRRKATQESLQQLQLYLQNIIDSMPSVLIGVDSRLNVTLWNKRAEQESILKAEEARGLSMSQVCRLFDSTAYMPKLSETLRTRKPTRLNKVRSVKKRDDGSYRFFDILIYPLSLTDESGAVIHMDDVTERIHLEEMMVRSEKMQSIGGLAAGLAHEINNPLAVILQNVQVLSRRLSPSLEKNQRTAEDLGTTIETIVEYTQLRGCEKIIHSISHAGQRAAKIVENMQSFSRRGVSRFIPCAIDDLLEKTIELASSDHDMRHTFNFKKIRIVRDFHTIPDVCCETSQIQQVILSLLKNAAQALSYGTDEPRINLRILPSGDDCICLQIEDNGIGMEQKVAARIFDPFYTTREVGSGTGLGLSIAYFMVVHNHGGHLSVTSELGKGSCFEMVLPVHQDIEKV